MLSEKQKIFFEKLKSSYGNEAFPSFEVLAREFGFSPTQMALSFVNSRKFVTSNIIGATDLVQLEENIKSIDINLSEKLLEEIEKIHDQNPYPCP